MIKNDRQFRIVRGRIDRLQNAERDLLGLSQSDPDDEGTQLQLAAVRAEAARLQDDVAEYEALRQGTEEVGVPESFEDLPRILIRARIAAGLSHADLATRLGLKEQQVQRYEATDYESASLGRMTEIAKALNVRLGVDVAPSSVNHDLAGFMRVLREAGVERDFLERRFVSPEQANDEARYVVAAVGRLSRVFGWLPETILEGAPKISESAMAVAAFKKPRTANERRTATLAAYAHYLVTRVVAATPTPSQEVPADAMSLRRAILSQYGSVTLETMLHAMWDSGVAVLPLAESGGFQAAYWRVSGNHAIVLKNGHRSESRWAFDLAHEIGHAADTASGSEVVEVDVLKGALTHERERLANEYAGTLLLGEARDELIAAALEKSGGKMAALQRAVQFIARKFEVDHGVLAFQVAHHLAELGHDWWGAAVNMQPSGDDPWRTVRVALVERIKWSRLDPLDRDLLTMALVDAEGGGAA